MKESNLVKKETDTERKRKFRKIHKRVKTSIETEQHSKAADVFYGTRQSKSQYESQRLALTHEEKEDAIIRTKKRNFYKHNFNKQFI